MNKKIRNKRIFQVLVVLLIMVAITFSAMSYSTGISGKTVNGCTCHGPSDSQTAVAVSSQSGNFTVNPNSTINLAAIISNSSQSHAGINIAVKTTQAGDVNAGTLAPGSGSGLQLSSNELTHSSPKSISGGEASFAFTWTAPSQPGTYYLRIAGNAVNNNSGTSGDQWNLMTVQEITVPGLDLLAPNGGQSLCPGGTINITWDAVGVENVKLELSSNGGSSFDEVLINSTAASSESWTWNISSELTPGNQYKIKISDASNASINDMSSSNFTIAESTEITTNPENQVSCTGQNIIFTVAAAGSELTYQWRKNGANLSGKTQSSLTINNTTLSDEGNYDCVVSGVCGDDVTSTSASLELSETPNITSQPKSLNKCVGEVAEFNVTATGDNITYQWYKDGDAISGATSNSHLLSSTSESDAGEYKVIVSGSCEPAAESMVADLVVNSAPMVVSSPANVEVCENDEITLTVTAEGSNIGYQWRKDGQDIQNATNSTFIIANAELSDNGNYDVRVSGDCSDDIFSDLAIVKVNENPVIVINLDSAMTVTEGQNTLLRVSVDGVGLSFQWYKDEMMLANEIDSILFLNSVTMDDQGEYFCIISNDCMELQSMTTVLTVEKQKSGPSITLSHESLDFGIILLGNNQTMEFENLITNSGDEDLVISELNLINGNQAFDIEELASAMTLAPGASMSITLVFSPMSGGEETEILQIVSNTETDATIVLNGFGGILDIAFSELNIDFGEIEIGKDKVNDLEIMNDGNFDINILELTIEGGLVDNFSLDAIDLPLTLVHKDELTLNINYSPITEGKHEAVLKIITDIDSVFQIPLEGISKIVSVNEIAFDAVNSTFPNPVQDELKIKFNSGTSGMVNIIIIDNNGSIVKRDSYVSSSGSNVIIWNLHNSKGTRVSAGSYNVILKGKNWSEQFKVIVE